MTIRPATLNDVAEIVTMAEAFAAQTDYGRHITISPSHVASLAESLIQDGSGAVLVAQDRGGAVVGMLALKAFEHPMSGQRIATEFVWWVEPAHRGSAGVRLLKAGEQWARDAGATALQMVAPNARVGAFYEAVGYQSVETSYVRAL
jgi:GNAT superfamily N-acetyltransferase